MIDPFVLVFAYFGAVCFLGLILFAVVMLLAWIENKHRREDE